MYIYGIGGLIMFIWFCSVFYKVRKKSEANEETIEELKAQIATLRDRVWRLENPSAKQVETRGTTADEDARIARSYELYKKYNNHINNITDKISMGHYQTHEPFAKDVMSPREWPENASGTKDTRFALYDYYNKLLPSLIAWRTSAQLVNEVCEEAYRLIGFIGININGQNSDIMSYMCDVEQSANGKSQRLTTICKKLDSIGALDRGQPFGNRLR